jgi:p-cumate 2,3-dioxygenase subunit beta
MTFKSLRLEVEDFLYREAALLDAWRLDEWLSLFAEDGTYEIPAPDDPDGKSDSSLFVVADDFARLKDRVVQLLGDKAWAERPRSRTRRILSNVIAKELPTGEVDVWSNFVVYRTRLDKISVFFGRHQHLLARHDDTFKIRKRRSVLDLESLQSVGKVSFIL